MNGPFTAKDFRTWGGTVAAATALLEKEQEKKQNDSPDVDQKTLTSDMVEAVKTAAKQLGNRPATCRRYYIHPAVFELYKAQKLEEAIADHPVKESALLDFLDTEEQNTLSILRATQM